MSRPVVIIGAPRSGTNMLRDVLCRVPGLGTWPCDEINYIWRHGNVRYSSDEFTVDMARPIVRRSIQRRFAEQQKLHRVVVEKTCANSLRVPFVDKVIPQARYVFIVRDGIDAVSFRYETMDGRAGPALFGQKSSLCTNIRHAVLRVALPL